MSYATDIAMARSVARAVKTFRRLNTAEGLTEDDRRCLKEAYVKNYLEPEARRLFQVKLKRDKEDEEFRQELHKVGRL